MSVFDLPGCEVSGRSENENENEREGERERDEMRR